MAMRRVMEMWVSYNDVYMGCEVWGVGCGGV